MNKRPDQRGNRMAVHLDERLLLLVPLLCYLLSYAYLAWYHGRLNLWHIVVHESGKLTFYQDLFYSSHFLAHVPVHLVIALFFTGTYYALAPKAVTSLRKAGLFGIAAVVFLGLAYLHALYEFGWTDTWDYILQRKQGADRFGEGGSWKLHLVSTISLPFFLPAFVFVGRRLFGRGVAGNVRGWPWLAVAAVLLFPMSYLLEGKGLISLGREVFADNRYLAHSVRELVTFGLCYFPPVLYLFFRLEGNGRTGAAPRSAVPVRGLLICSGIFLLLLAYQTYFPLTEGIGSLAQKPAFARGGELGIGYLLASHFFEHFLDSLFFTLAAGFLFCLGNRPVLIRT